MSISDFFAAWELFRAPTLAGVYAGVMLGMLGVFIVLRRMVFLSAALSQVASLGVVLSFMLLAAVPALGAIPITSLCGTVLTLGVLLAIVRLRRVEESSADIMLGLAFLLGSAGTLALGSRVVEDIHDVDTLLLGTAVAVVPDDVTRLAILMTVTVVMLLWWSRGFFATSFDREHAAIRGIPVTFLDVVLLSLIAASISLTTSVLGALPTFAFSVLPAVAAIAIATSPSSTLVIAGVVGGATGFVGYIAAYLWELPVGSSYALVGLTFAALAWAIRLALPR
jgi:zinc transport system permease protein